MSVRILIEQYHTDVETKDNNEYASINNASIKGHLEAVKYLYKTCHANVENKNEYGILQ